MPDRRMSHVWLVMFCTQRQASQTRESRPYGTSTLQKPSGVNGYGAISHNGVDVAGCVNLKCALRVRRCQGRFKRRALCTA